MLLLNANRGPYMGSSMPHIPSATSYLARLLTIDSKTSYLFPRLGVRLVTAFMTGRNTGLRYLRLSVRVVATGYDRSYVQSCHESSAIVRSVAQPVVRLTATGRNTNLCMRSKFCISPNINDRLYVLHSNRQKLRSQKKKKKKKEIVRSGVTKAYLHEQDVISI